MTSRQIVAVIAPLLLIAVMVPVFQLITRRYGNMMGWFAGLFIYWILWHGTYLALFQGNIVYQIIWPSIWFALWHYAPGSVASGGNVMGLMISALFFGLFLSLLARQTNTIWWSIVAHTLAGIVMVI
jgi:hypothetical protein